MKKQLIYFTTITLLIFVADLWTKSLAQKFFTTTPLKITNFLKLELSLNQNLAFGIPLPYILIIIFSLIALGILILIFWKFIQKNYLNLTGFALIFGGALGNLFERIFVRQVTDFVKLFFIPNFNLADIAIIIGSLLLIIQNSEFKIKSNSEL